MTEIGSDETLSITRPSIGDRMERLPFTKYQVKLVAILAMCYLVDAVDLQMISYLLSPISKDLGLTNVQAGFVASSVFVGMAVGATVAGTVADRYGRRTVLVSSMVLWGFASLLTAFAWNLESFLAFRVLTGIGLGAELPIAFTLLAELVPAARRARLTSWMSVAAVLGIAGYNLLALGVIKIVGPDTGWRIMFGTLFIVACFAMYVRRTFPESPRWLESRGRKEDAERVMSQFEDEVERAYGKPLPSVVPATKPEQRPEVSKTSVRALFAKDSIRRTVLAFLLWPALMFPYYGISTWVGKLLVDRGMSVSSSLTVGILMGLAAIPAVILVGQLMDRIGRKKVLIASLVLVTIGALAYGNATGFWIVVACGAIMQMGMQAVGLSLNTYTPELFATSVRATGVGAAQTLGRIAAIASPLAIPFIVLHWGYNGTFIVFAAFFAIGGALLIIFGPESKDHTIEELSNL